MPYQRLLKHQRHSKTRYYLIWQLSFVLARWVTRVAHSDCMVSVPYDRDSTETRLSDPAWGKLKLLPSLTQVVRDITVQAV